VAGTSFAIRTGTAPDLDAVLWLWRATGIQVGPSETPEALARKLERDPELFLVAESAGDVVGAVLGAFDGRRGWIYHLAVRTDHERHGIGRALLDAVETRLRALGCLKVNLLVEPDNAAVVPFYERLGYGRDDLIFLEKWLDEGRS
jgi:ribosomal protein S18 acetylase RimI-like enzyme